jgi:hypothetical protein
VLERKGRTFDIEVQPRVYHVPLLSSEMLEGDIFYIRIASIGMDIDKEVQRLLDAHPETKGVILDFSDNPGGYVVSACYLADLLLPTGKFVGLAYASGTDWLYLTQPARYQQPLICLVNGESASAAEIFPAVVQDYQRGLIVGSQTFGKFSSQTIVQLDSDWWLKYTFSQVLTAASRSLNGIGLTPDVSLDTPQSALAFAHTLLLNTAQAPTAHTLVFDFDANQIYRDARSVYPSQILRLDTETLVKLRDVTDAMQIPLRWDPQTSQITFAYNNIFHVIDTTEDDLVWHEGYYYLSLDRLAGYVRGSLQTNQENAVLYYN